MVTAPFGQAGVRKAELILNQLGRRHPRSQQPPAFVGCNRKYYKVNMTVYGFLKRLP